MMTWDGSIGAWLDGVWMVSSAVKSARVYLAGVFLVGPSVGHPRGRAKCVGFCLVFRCSCLVPRQRVSFWVFVADDGPWCSFCLVCLHGVGAVQWSFWAGSCDGPRRSSSACSRGVGVQRSFWAGSCNGGSQRSCLIGSCGWGLLLF
jgi:hypothetical protein